MDADDLSTPARLALRRRADGSLDDVGFVACRCFGRRCWTTGGFGCVVNLPGTAVDRDRIAFEVVARGDRIELEVIETPAGVVSIEEAG
jgi:hypothetical protein